MTTFLLAGRYARGARQAPGRRRPAGAARARRQGRRRAARRRRARASRSSELRGRRPVRRPARARRSPPTAWSIDGASAVDASMLTGESVPVEVGPGDAVVGATVNAGGRLVVRATRVGADTQLAQMARLVEEAQNGKAPGAAAGRPGLRRSSCRSCSCSPRPPSAVWLLDRRRRGRRVHRRRRRADHRLPLRARAGHADRADGRHRPRRPARHPDQGPRGAGVHPPGRHRRARQDRHGHHRPDDACVDVVPAAGEDADEVLRLAGAVEAASEHPIARAVAAAAARHRPLPAGRGLRATVAGLGVRGVVDGHAVVVGRPRLLADAALPLPAELDAAAGRGRGRRAHGGRRRLGRRRARRARRRRRGQADVGRGRPPAARPRAAPRPAHRRQRGGRRARSPPRSASTTVDRRGAAAGQGRRRPAAAGRGPGRRHGRRRRQRRRRARPGRPRAGDGHRHRRRDRGQRPHAGPRRPARGRRRDPAVPPHARHDQGQPVLGVRLQRRRDPAGRGRPAQPDDRRRRDGVQLGVRGDQQPAAAPLHPRSARRPRRGTSTGISGPSRAPCSSSRSSPDQKLPGSYKLRGRSAGSSPIAVYVAATSSAQ